MIIGSYLSEAVKCLILLRFSSFLAVYMADQNKGWLTAQLKEDQSTNKKNANSIL